MPALENQIREALAHYAHRDMTFDEFLQWFVPIACNLDPTEDAEAIELVHRIDGLLAEASAAGWSEEDIHEELARPFVTNPFAENVFGDPNLFPTAESTAESVMNHAEAA